MNQLSHGNYTHPGPFSSNNNNQPQPGYYAPLQQQQANTGNQGFAYPQQGYQDGYSQQATGSAGGGMMHAGQQSKSPYTTAPYSQSIPASSTPTQPQQPSPTSNANNIPTQPNSSTPPTKYPMAAPPLPQSQSPATNTTPQPTSNAVTTPQTPQSPTSTQTPTREHQRINLLLDLNLTLMTEINRLRDLGQNGAISAAQAAQLKSAGQNSQMGSEEYIQTMRRLQANMGYLVPKAQAGANPAAAEQSQKQAPQGPPMMTPPPHMQEELREKYEKLQELFPGWLGVDQRMAAAGRGMGGGGAGSPKQQQQGGSANGGMNATGNSMP